MEQRAVYAVRTCHYTVRTFVNALRISVRSCSTLNGLKSTACNPSWVARRMLWLGS